MNVRKRATTASVDGVYGSAADSPGTLTACGTWPAPYVKGNEPAGGGPAVAELGGPDTVSWNEFWQRLKKALGQRRPSLHVPVGLMRLNAMLTERLPGNIPLTRDLLTMLEHGDNVVSNDDAVRTFELPLVPLDEQLRRAT